MSDMPGLDEDVMARFPVAAAPSTMLIEAISLSAWMKGAAGLRQVKREILGDVVLGVMG